MAEFTDWPAPARALLDRAILRYGGDAGRERLGALELEPTSIGGLLLWLKGLGKSFVLPARAEIDGRAARAIFHDFPERGKRGWFESGRVGIAADAELPAFGEHRARVRRKGTLQHWEPSDALYFFGYALSHYHSLPWSLQAARLLSCDERARWVRVEFPPHVHTHSARQTFYFDETGLIVRHDYVAEVVGWWARAAHYWLDYADVRGVPVAHRRLAYARLGRLRLPIVAVDVRFR
jgi:hypothetical protein